MKTSNVIIAIVISFLVLIIIGLSIGLVYVINSNNKEVFSISKTEEKPKDFETLAKEFGESFGNETDLKKYFTENIDYEIIAAINTMTFESVDDDEIIAEFEDAKTKITDKSIEEGKSSVDDILSSYLEYSYFGTPLAVKSISNSQEVKYLPMLNKIVVTYEYGDGNEVDWDFLLYENKLILALPVDMEDVFLSAFSPTPEKFVKGIVVKLKGSKEDYINYMLMNADVKQNYVTDIIDRSDVNYSKVTGRASYNEEMTKAATKKYNEMTEEEIKQAEADFKESRAEEYDEFHNTGLKIKSMGQLQDNKFFPFLKTLYVTFETEDGTKTYDYVFNFYNDKFAFYEDQDNYEEGVQMIERYLNSL